MLWEGSDLVALGVASFGHLSGIHYQNKTHWDDYLAAIDADQLPVGRGFVAESRELLIRELVLGLKKGSVDTARLCTKYGIDPLIEWAGVWSDLGEKGFFEPIGTNDFPTLTRQGLLQVDSLLHHFFDK
jgi:oxygen-independent coproporphyrinogen-3 oxidase